MKRHVFSQFDLLTEMPDEDLSKKIIIAIGCVTALVSAEISWGDCVQNLPGAEFTSKVAANLSCGGLTPQSFGCKVNSGTGSCTYTAPDGKAFQATTTLQPAGNINWVIAPVPGHDLLKVDAVIANGGTAGNACGYYYAKEAVSGTGLGDKKTNGGYGNIQDVSFCTDNINPPEPFVRELNFNNCPQDIQDALNENTIPGDFAIVGNISNANSITMCLKENAGITVQPCVNWEKPANPDPSVRYCSDGPDGQPVDSLEIKRDITFLMQKTGSNSCVYTCLPPPLTFAGTGKSCGWLCK